jgi:predicted alpha/beta-hydrolase family hydrolase
MNPALRAAVEALREIVPGPIDLGGQSYGGRQASMLAVEQPDLVRALLLLSYPLHPPGKPEAMRTAHFAALRVPALFVHGEADPFATGDELLAATALIPARTRIITVERAGHDLGRGRIHLAEIVAGLAQIGTG